MDNEYQHIEFDQLTLEQRHEARAIFKDDRMTDYTYALRCDGTVFQWRYFKSEILSNQAVLRAVLGK